MTSIVTISAPSENVKASAEGLAEHAFSVTNITAGRLAVGVQILVDAPAEQSWFTIQGAMKRELAPNETDQVVVKAKLPADTKPGEYRFKLQVYSTERGRAGEDFTNGSTVAVEMPEPAPAPVAPTGGSGVKWWMIVVAAAAVLVIGGVVTWLLWPNGGVEMPELANKVTVQTARGMLEDLGIKSIREESTESADFPADFVLDQDPEVGKTISKDTQVTLWVAQPPGVETVSIPNVARLSLDVAKQKLQAAGLNVTENPKRVATLEFKPGEVTQQVPQAFSEVAPGSEVTLSIAGESVKVPTVKGSPLQTAITKMTQAKLLVVNVTGDQDKMSQGVVSSTPPEGQLVLAGSEVTIHMPGQFVAIPIFKLAPDIKLHLNTNRGIQ